MIDEMAKKDSYAAFFGVEEALSACLNKRPFDETGIQRGCPSNRTENQILCQGLGEFEIHSSSGCPSTLNPETVTFWSNAPAGPCALPQRRQPSARRFAGPGSVRRY